ncbi:MAG TPA: HAD hydrolase family protein [Methylomirabilota bacterium]|nr:HAD hydrolase family protein [Methylomirabilota bacterium]
MRYYALACDYDGTLASGGRVPPETLGALRSLRESGRKLILVTGRRLADLRTVFQQLDLFDRVVAENGAVLLAPERREERQLAEPPGPEFVRALARRGVAPLAAGRVVVATTRPHEVVVLAVIRELGLELQVVFNRDAVMVLPSGVNKGTGLRAALDELALSPHNVVGIGDAENDHGFLELCGCAVAVADALPAVRRRADLVTAGGNGRGVVELVDRLLRDDLAAVGARHLRLGRTPDGREVRVQALGENVLIAGTSGAGKSTLAAGLLEQLGEGGYQFCIVDPEGDYQALEGAVALGDAGHPPSVREVVQLLERPSQNVSVNLLGIGLDHRPAFSEELLIAVLELRARTGRPHWIVIDEAHHLLPANWAPAALTLPRALHGVLMITVHPNHVSPAILSAVDVVIALGKAPRQTLGNFASGRGTPVPDGPALDDLPSGEALAWRPADARSPVRFQGVVPRAERRRHRRKYADGELPPERSFYFRGPEGKLNLRAQNLRMFLQVADGVDEATWVHHLRSGDVARWLRDAIKDPDLARAVAALEDRELSAAESRRRVRALIEERYTEAA